MNFIKTDSLPFFVIVTSLLLAIFSENTTTVFQYERSEIIHYQFWRLLTAHFIHAGWEHLLLNLSALILIWLLFRNFISIYLWWLFTLISALGISLSLFFFMSELEWYVGLSGVLHSMLVFGAISGLIHKRKEFILLLFFIFAKILFEQIYGSYSFSVIGLEGVIVVNAHMYGAIIGLIIGTFLFYLRRPKEKIKPKIAKNKI